jgi:hypothetical protein
MCALGYEGKGYSSDFTANMTRIVMGQLRGDTGDDTPIKLTGYADDICAPCPKRVGRLCTSQQQIALLDRSHAQALDLQPREELTWGQAKERIRAKIMPGTLEQLCLGCKWLELGLCEAALTRLHAEPDA